MVVLSVMAITTALIWRSGPLGSRLALRAAAAELAGDLRAVQARAMAERDPERAHGIEFPPEGDRYVLVVSTGLIRTAISIRRLRPGVHVTYARFGGPEPSIVSFSTASLYGAPSGGGTVTFAGGNARLCVRLLPATGRVRVTSTDCP